MATGGQWMDLNDLRLESPGGTAIDGEIDAAMEREDALRSVDDERL